MKLFFWLCLSMLSCFSTCRGSSETLDSVMGKVYISGLSLNSTSIPRALAILTKTIRSENDNNLSLSITYFPGEVHTSRKFTLTAGKSSARSALELICKQSKMTYRGDTYAVVVAPSQTEIDFATKKLKDFKNREPLERGAQIFVKTFECENMPLAQAVALLNRKIKQTNITGSDFLVQANLDKASKEIKVNAWLYNMPALRIARYICISSGLEFETTDTGLRILSNKQKNTKKPK